MPVAAMTKRLLDRQVSLLDYLTSRGAIFGERSASLHEDLAGIDRNVLDLEARFSHHKRMDKILGVFPRTFELLGSDQASIVRDFVAACPPEDISRLANARQFHAYLAERRRREPPSPPYLRDVAACEFACAKVRAGSEDQYREESDPDAALNGIRRRPGIALLRCAYDIAPIFDQGLRAKPAERDTPLAIAMTPGADQPQVFELMPVVFDLLSALDDWTDPATLGPTPELDALVRQLGELGLLELRR
jgi:hypothetical protein